MPRPPKKKIMMWTLSAYACNGKSISANVTNTQAGEYSSFPAKANHLISDTTLLIDTVVLFMISRYKYNVMQNNHHGEITY